MSDVFADDARLGPKGNRPPSDIEILRERLAEQSAALLRRRDELLGSVARVPAAVTDEETSGKVADLVKLMMACHKAAEGTRIAEKEPFLASGRAVDAFFKAVTEPLEAAKKLIESRLTTYQRKKAEDERRAREAEAARVAAEAERLRVAAEAAAAAISTPADLDSAVTAEALAEEAAADTVQAAREAAAKPAELSRTRGDLGAVASLRTYWDFADLDREKLDLSRLRPYIAVADLEKAVRAYIRAGGRELAGVRIFENTGTQVR